jgi:hypothetical protein
MLMREVAIPCLASHRSPERQALLQKRPGSIGVTLAPGHRSQIVEYQRDPALAAQFPGAGEALFQEPAA